MPADSRDMKVWLSTAWVFPQQKCFHSAVFIVISVLSAWSLFKHRPGYLARRKDYPDFIYVYKYKIQILHYICSLLHGVLLASSRTRTEMKMISPQNSHTTEDTLKTTLKRNIRNITQRNWLFQILHKWEKLNKKTLFILSGHVRLLSLLEFLRSCEEAICVTFGVYIASVHCTRVSNVD